MKLTELYLIAKHNTCHSFIDAICQELNLSITDKNQVDKVKECEVKFIIKLPKKNIEQRKSEFILKIRTLYQDKGNFNIIDEFCDYWTEHGEKDRKMRFEKERSFDISKRLVRWQRNSKKFNNGKASMVKNDL